ncbi:MAG TPA: DUF4175 family protein [Polyangiaceae bacterium]|nr:DUF4175 family protein [Polyangiaceae bacterium]
MSDSSRVLRLAALFQEHLGGAPRRFSWALLLVAWVGAAHLARLGTWTGRGAAVLVLVSSIGLAVALVRRERARLTGVPAVLRHVVWPIDPRLGQRASRAHELLVKTERDRQWGSMELAEHHFRGLLAKVPLTAVSEAARGRARRFLWGALACLGVMTALIAVEPVRLLEGYDILAARGGVAPVPMPWFESAGIGVKPPAYLHLPEYALFMASDSALPEGSTVKIRGLPVRPGRRLVLTDGQQELPFVEDGSGQVVAQLTLQRSVQLRIAARFGDVLIYDPDEISLQIVPDQLPKVELVGAPRELALREVDHLELPYSVSDDHGIKQIDLVLRSAGRVERRTLSRLDGQTLSEHGAHAIDARDSFFKRVFLPVRVTIEARDNEALHDDRWSASEAITLHPPGVGEPQALRMRGLRGAVGALIDALQSELALEAVKKGDLKSIRDAEARALGMRKQALAELDQAFDATYASLSVASGLRAFLKGQLRTLAASRTDRKRRLEDVVLALDAALRAQAQRDAEDISRRLGDVAEEVAEAAKAALGSEERNARPRLDLALRVLDGGAENLLALGTLGADLGSVAQGELGRIRRALQARSLVDTELAARHLAARLRRPSPSFSSAGGGSVESGRGSSSGPPEGSEADREFDQMMRELAELTEQHADQIRGLEGILDQAERGQKDDQLSREAAERAERIREAASQLPEAAAALGPARAASARAREQLSNMAQNFERLDLKEAVAQGRAARGSLDEALRLQQDLQRGSDTREPPEQAAAREALGRELAWAEKQLQKLAEQAANRAREGLAERSPREEGLARRAGNLAGRGEHSQAKLPEESVQALEQAENAMQRAANELAQGRGEQALQLAREAQRLIEQSNPENGSDPQDSGDQRAESEQRAGKKGMATKAAVPGKDKGARAEEFRRRVLEGLSKARRERLSKAVERYAEGLLE